MNTIKQILSKFSQQNPEYGEYQSHIRNTFTTTGFLVKTTTGFTLGISDELVTDFQKGNVDTENLKRRVKIIRTP